MSNKLCQNLHFSRDLLHSKRSAWGESVHPRKVFEGKYGTASAAGARASLYAIRGEVACGFPIP